MSSRFKGLLTAFGALVLCVSVAHAIDIPNMTPNEAQMMQSLDPSGDDPFVLRGPSHTHGSGPTYYVNPSIRAREVVLGPQVSGTSVNSLRAMLLSGRPSLNAPILPNGGFEDGNLGNWTTQGAAGTGSPSVCGSPMTPEAIVLTPGLQPYANNDPLMDQVYQGSYACRLGDDYAWGFSPSTEPQCSEIYQDVVVPAGTVNFKFAYAVLASNPGHGYGYDPYFNVRVDDLTSSSNLYNVTDYTTSYNPANPCAPWCLGGYDANGGANIVYRRWTQVTLDLSAVAGHTVRLSLKSSDCSPSAHFCEAFLDGAGVVCDDNVGPDAVTLNATCAEDPAVPGTLCAQLTWNAPSDPTQTPDPATDTCVPGTGPAAFYDIRWSTTPIVTAADFAAATQFTGEPTPSAPGTAESFSMCGLPEGTYYFGLVSIDQSFNTSPLATASTVCIINRPPDCSAATASIAELWPPDHRMVNVGVVGVTDPDGDPITITVTGITQDEPLNTKGDGNTCPDAINNGATASLRAERTGNPQIPGDGRVYVVSYEASDGRGGTCTGTVSVCVPHDQGQHHYCVDSGQGYDATSCPSTHFGISTADDGDVVEFAARVVSGVVNDRGNITLEYRLPRTADVDVSVFDVAGRRMATLDHGVKNNGVFRAVWNTRGVARGMYFIRVHAGANALTRSVLVLP